MGPGWIYPLRLLEILIFLFAVKLSICLLPGTAFISNHISAEINFREPAAIINSLLLIIKLARVIKYSVSSADVKCGFLRESRKFKQICVYAARHLSGMMVPVEEVQNIKLGQTELA